MDKILEYIFKPAFNRFEFGAIIGVVYLIVVSSIWWVLAGLLVNVISVIGERKYGDFKE